MRLLALCGAGKPPDHVTQETSQWNQMKILLYRGYIKTKRDMVIVEISRGMQPAQLQCFAGCRLSLNSIYFACSFRIMRAAK